MKILEKKKFSLRKRKHLEVAAEVVALDSEPLVRGGQVAAAGEERRWRVEMESGEPRAECRGKRSQPGRLEYLDQLVVEFQTTKSKDAKEQILANLSNFAYDPFNYEYFRQLNVLDLFLDNLSDREENLIKFSIGGLCNLSLDPANKEYITKHGLNKIIKLLEHKNLDVVLSTITTLMFLITPESKAEITKSHVIGTVIGLSKKENLRLKNLSRIFVEDYCTEEKMKEALTFDISEIPLPKS